MWTRNVGFGLAAQDNGAAMIGAPWWTNGAPATEGAVPISAAAGTGAWVTAA